MMKMASTSAVAAVSASSAASSPSPHLCLRWNNYQSNLTSVFDQLLQNETFVDVTLAADGHAIKAHRMVLSACSPYFQHLFFDNPCQHPIVILKDTRWPELKAIVEYMYRGEISVAQEELTSLLKVAETLKIRGLSELNSDRSAAAATSASAGPNAMTHDTHSEPSPIPPPTDTLRKSPVWHAGNEEEATRSPTPAQSPAPRKRRRVSGPDSPAHSPEPASTPGMAADDTMDEAPMPLIQQQHQHHQLQQHLAPAPVHSPVMMPQLAQQQHPIHSDDLDIKPGIAELIREEERARMLEGTHPWLAGSPSVLSDTYQYQLQALWQKAWATGQGVMQNLRFRERGPFKTWRPETMAEAIMAVLREGLSLSQAARKFDIPYPTFVLYANRVNNMLGPSADGGSELRPKGRGRPQRILTGSWPEDHVHGVIRAVVFRDPSSLPRHIDREDASKLTANRPAPGATSRLLTPQSQPEPPVGANIRGLIQSAMSNGNAPEFAQQRPNVPSTLSHGGPMIPGASSAYSSIRQMAGPSSAASGIMELLAASSNSSSGNNNNNINVQLAGNVAAPSPLSTSTLFSALQQEVSDEARLAALNAMTQRIMNTLDGENFNLASCINSSLNSQGSRGVPNAAALEAAAWFGPTASFAGPIVDVAGEDVAASPDDDDDDDDDQPQQVAPFNSAPNNPVPVKPEQLFTE